MQKVFRVPIAGLVGARNHHVLGVLSDFCAPSAFPGFVGTLTTLFQSAPDGW